MYIKIENDKIVAKSSSKIIGGVQVLQELLSEYEQGGKSVRINDEGVVEVYDTPKTDEELAEEQMTGILDAYNTIRSRKEELKARIVEWNDVDNTGIEQMVSDALSELQTELNTLNTQINSMLAQAVSAYGTETVKTMLLTN